MQVKKKIDETIADRNTFHTNWRTEEALRIKREKELAETKEALDQRTRELAAAQEALATKDAEIAQLNTDLTRTRNDLTRARADRDAAQAKVVAYELTGLTPDEVKEVIARLKQSLEDIKGLNEEIAKRDTTIEGLEVRIAELVGPSDVPVILPAGLKGKVVTVDPKWDFIVIDLGKNDGLLLNGQMLVSRNGKLLAKVRIVNVMDNRAIANVMGGWKLDDIMEGDTVLY
ncbi:MAG TPA: hypothetical protein DCY13_22155 [Verrucomicrobiales bacterium]|nr:hypothetical protein [Verrucomicrobiales bacterium]